MDNWDDLSGPDEDRVLPMMEKLEGFAKRLNALFPDPQPRTLADMTPAEREACRWMQAGFTETEYWHVITAVAGEKSWLLRQEDGSSFEVPNSQITPLPDLPRMVWPDEHPTAEETTDPPRPEDVPEGEAWIMTYDGDEWVGTRASHDGVWSLARMDGEECRYADGCRVTLVSRLVPEVEA